MSRVNCAPISLESEHNRAAELLEQLPKGEIHLGDALQAAALLIKRFQPDSPRLDAEVIVGKLWDKSATFLFAHPEAVVPPDMWQRLAHAVVKRCLGCPVAYLTGEKEFYNYSFYVSPATLIPRPETEFLVEAACLELHNRVDKTDIKVLDLCTGSGNVALSIALEEPQSRVWAQDISAEALAMADRNRKRYDLSERVQLLGGDLFDEIPPELRFTVITANPPYIAEDGSLPAEENVVKYEPYRALYAGSDGLEVIRRLIDLAPRYLEPDGLLLMEIGCDQGERVANLLKAAHLEDVQISQDLQNLPRIAKARFVLS